MKTKLGVSINDLLLGILSTAFQRAYSRQLGGGLQKSISVQIAPDVATAVGESGTEASREGGAPPVVSTGEDQEREEKSSAVSRNPESPSAGPQAGTGAQLTTEMVHYPKKNIQVGDDSCPMTMEVRRMSHSPRSGYHAGECKTRYEHNGYDKYVCDRVRQPSGAFHIVVKGLFNLSESLFLPYSLSAQAPEGGRGACVVHQAADGCDEELRRCPCCLLCSSCYSGACCVSLSLVPGLRPKASKPPGCLPQVSS